MADPNLSLNETVPLADAVLEARPDTRTRIIVNDEELFFPPLTEDRVQWDADTNPIAYFAQQVMEQEGDRVGKTFSNWIGLVMAHTGITSISDLEGIPLTQVDNEVLFRNVGFDDEWNDIPNWINKPRVKQIITRCWNAANYGNIRGPLGGGGPGMNNNDDANDNIGDRLTAAIEALAANQANQNPQNQPDAMSMMFLSQALGGNNRQGLDLCDIVEMMHTQNGGQKLEINELYKAAGLEHLDEAWMVPRKMIQTLALAKDKGNSDLGVSPFPYIDIGHKKFIPLGMERSEVIPGKQMNDFKWLRAIFAWLQGCLVAGSITSVDLISYMNVILKITSDHESHVAYEYHCRKMKSLERKSETIGSLDKVEDAFATIDTDLLTEVKFELKWEKSVGLLNSPPKRQRTDSEDHQGGGTYSSSSKPAASDKSDKFKQWAADKPCRKYNNGDCSRGQECWFAHTCMDCGRQGCWHKKSGCPGRK